MRIAIIFIITTLLPALGWAQEKPSVELSAQYDKVAVAMPRLSPRPEAVAGVTQPVISLNGEWFFSPDGQASDASKRIQVPGEWAMQGFSVPQEGWAEYLRSFEVPADWKGQAIKLRFDAVSAVCKVSVNGQEVGSHEGGFVPFELDITKAVKIGANNELRVKVQCESLSDKLEWMSVYAEHQVGGLLRKVTLFALPPSQVAGQYWEVKFDDVYKDATLTVKSTVDGEIGKKLTLKHELLDANGGVIATLEGTAQKETVLNQLIKSPAHWTTETPDLYTLKTSLLQDGRVLESFSTNIGFRELKVRGRQVLLNGVPLKLLGACHHDIHPLTGRSVSPEIERQDVELFRAANCNILRTSHYPPSEEFLDACDKLGMMVEAEAALCWVGHKPLMLDGKKVNATDPAVYARLLSASYENIAANRNHPSVIMWSIANESRWSPAFDAVNANVKKLDATRPTVFHEQNWAGNADIANKHYPGPQVPLSPAPDQRPVYYGEYAHVECYNHRELSTDPFVRADWGRPLVKFVDDMWAKPEILGGAIWSGVDDMFHMPDGQILGYGEWGIIDGWRRKKPEWFGTREAYTPVRFILINGESAPKDGEARFKVENRYGYTDLKGVPMNWTLRDKNGEIKMDLAPRSSGEFKIPLAGVMDGDRLVISVRDPRGFTALEQAFQLGSKKAMPAPAAPAGVKAELTADAADQPIVVTAGPMTYTMDRNNGKLSFSQGDGQILDITPVLMLLKLDDSGGRPSGGARKFLNKPEPFTSPCQGRKIEGIVAEQKDDSVEIAISDSYQNAQGTTTLTIGGAGIKVRYQYTYTEEKNLDPRQWGVMLNLPKDYNHLSWSNTIDGEKQADANPIGQDILLVPRKDLSGQDWWLDSTPLGSNLFRSTKPDVSRSALGNGKYRVELAADGAAPLCTRAWVDKDYIGFLAAGYNTGGAEGYYSFYGPERRPLKKGATVEGSFWLTVGPVKAE